MIVLKESLQNIRDNLSHVLSQFRNICLKQLNNLPSKIEEIVIGENKILSYANGSIDEITENDLRNVTSINNYAFYYCDNLITVTVPKNIIAIGFDAFYGCNNLINIYLYPIIPPTLDGSTTIPSTTIIHVPIGSGNAYKSATNWSSYASNIVEDIEI